MEKKGTWIVVRWSNTKQWAGNRVWVRALKGVHTVGIAEQDPGQNLKRGTPGKDPSVGKTFIRVLEAI